MKRTLIWLSRFAALGLVALAISMFSIHENYPGDARTFFLMFMGGALLIWYVGQALNR